MANLKNIKLKIKAISNIKKITKTMEMVSFAKMKKANEATLAISPYISEIKSLISRLVEQMGNENINLFTESKSSEEILIVFASNKGLCGSYNGNVYKKSKKYLEENSNIKKAIAIGKFGERIAKRLGLEIVESYIEIDKMGSIDFTRMEKSLRESFLNNNYKKVHVTYTNFIKNGVYEATANCVYPVSRSLEKLYSKDISDRENSLYVYEPSVNSVLENLIPKLISTILYSYHLESRASEHSMRSFAMKRAKDAAGEMVEGLKLTYNKVRQDGITQEIAEISAGANN